MVEETHCQWTNHTKLTKMSSDEIQFVGCTWYLHKNFTHTDTFILTGNLDIKMRHRNSQHWSREKHVIHQRRERFVGVIEMEVNNLCLNKTYKDYYSTLL